MGNPLDIVLEPSEARGNGRSRFLKTRKCENLQRSSWRVLEASEGGERFPAPTEHMAEYHHKAIRVYKPFLESSGEPSLSLVCGTHRSLSSRL